jgi:hypothetical protein
MMPVSGSPCSSCATGTCSTCDVPH